MSIILSLQKRLTAACLSQIMLLTSVCTFTANAVNPSKNLSDYPVLPNGTISCSYSDFEKVSKYLEKKINLTLNNSIYLNDLYLASYQGILCLHVYRAADPIVFYSIKNSLLNRTIYLVRMFKFLAQICPFKEEYQKNFKSKINILEKFLTESLDVKEEELEISKFFTNQYCFSNVTWKKDSKSKTFILFRTDDSFHNKFFNTVTDLIRNINEISLNLKTRITGETPESTTQELNSFLTTNMIHDFKMKDIINPLKETFYQKKLGPSNIHSGTLYYNPVSKYDKIKEGRTKIGVNDYISLLMLNVFDYAQLKNDFCKDVRENAIRIIREKSEKRYRQMLASGNINKENQEEICREIESEADKEAWTKSLQQTSNKLNKLLRKILFMISYYNACITHLDKPLMIKFKEKISKIEEEFTYNQLKNLSYEEVYRLDKKVEKMTIAINRCSDFYIKNLQNNVIPLDITKADLNYYDTSTGNEPVYKISCGKKAIMPIRKIIYETLKKCDIEFKPNEISRYNKNLSYSFENLFEALSDLKLSKNDKESPKKLKFHKSPRELVEIALELARQGATSFKMANKPRKSKLEIQKRNSQALVKKIKRKQQILKDIKFKKDFKISKINGEILTFDKMSKIKKVKQAFKDFRDKKSAPLK